MTTTVLLEVKAKAGTGDDVIAMFREVLDDTRAYDGCLGVETIRDVDDPDVVVLIERWSSRERYEAYLGWRQETGFVDRLVAALAGPPSIRYFETTNA